MVERKTKCGFVAIIGAPNVGKSTLTNQLVGKKITIVSPKVQTTRTSIRAIMVADETQLIFCDTPGIFFAKKNLEKAIVENALEQISCDTDIVFMINGRKAFAKENQFIIDHLTKLKRKVILIINKIDLLKPHEILKIEAQYKDLDIIDELLFISAFKNRGVDELKNILISRAPQSPFLYPEDQLTTATSRFLAQEVTREKLFNLLNYELPYNLSVETINWKESDNGEITIDQDIYVNKSGHKKIVIGTGGKILKKAGMLARKELSEILDCKINLFLYVKLREDWVDKPHMYKHMGLKFPK